MSRHADRMAQHAQIVIAQIKASARAVPNDPPSKAEHNHHDSVINALCPRCTPAAYATNRARHRGYPRSES